MPDSPDREPLLTLVTGASRGIGAATALALAAAGHDLVLAYRSDDTGAGEVAERARAAGARCLLVRADLTEPDGVDTVFDAVDAPLTGVVSNAGATLHTAPLADTPVEVVRASVGLNLTSALLVARRAARDLVDGGVLVNVSSGAATLGSPGEYVHYAAAKAGVDALTTGLALELAPRGVRVVGVAPGLVETGIHAGAGDPGRLERLGPAVPLGRVAAPAEVAATIVWLMGADASYVTGTTLRVAGGR